MRIQVVLYFTPKTGKNSKTGVSFLPWGREKMVWTDLYQGKEQSFSFRIEERFSFQ